MLHSKTEEIFLREIEAGLIYHLLFNENKSSILDRCTRGMFYHTVYQKFFDIIKENKDIDYPRFGQIALRLGTIEDLDMVSSTKHYNANPDSLIWILRNYQFFRISKNRAQSINNICDLAVSDASRHKIVQQAEKLLTLNKSLFRPTRQSSLDFAIESTINTVNSSSDIIRTGWQPLDNRTGGLSRRGISTVLAHYGNMKSTFSDHLVSSSVQHENKTGLIISLEDSIERRITRMVASRFNYSLESLRLKHTKIERSHVEQVMKIDLGGRLTILDPRFCSSIEDIVSAIEEYRADIVLVDHIQKLGEDEPLSKIANAINKIENACIKSNSHGIICSQVKDKNVGQREDKQPTSSDAHWTSVLSQNSTEMISLFYPFFFTKNPFEKELLHVEILKSKFTSPHKRFTVYMIPDNAKVLGEQQ